MRLATIIEDGEASVAVVHGDRVLPIGRELAFGSMRAIAGGGEPALRRITAWAAGQPDAAYRSLDAVELGPAVPDPGAFYTVGLNYRTSAEAEPSDPGRPLIYGKAVSSVTAQRAAVTWDRTLTANVDPECELGIVIGAEAFAVSPAQAMAHVFGYTCMNDISSRDPWLDGDQWLLGKSMPGFCPVGPWIVTRDELSVDDLRLGCTINGVAIQDGSTAQMRHRVPEIVSYLSHHVKLSPGDLIASGTPARLEGPLGPERHLEGGDVVTVWIERIGELTTLIT